MLLLIKCPSSSMTIPDLNRQKSSPQASSASCPRPHSKVEASKNTKEKP